jgi:RNA polymerase sigma-70 factor (ECF subfamily)
MDAAEELNLLARSRQGDATAFSQLVDQHRARILRLCQRLLGNLEDAQDVAQETFLQAHVGLEGFRGGSRLYTWLYRIAVNRCRSALKRRGPAWEALDEALPDPGPTPERSLSQRERDGRVDRALQRLSADLRVVVVLRDGLGCSYAEIAEVLDVPLGTVKSRISAARWALRHDLGAADDL